MAERLCLHDLSSPSLQQAADQLNRDRYALSSRLEQLQRLKPELTSLENVLSSHCQQVPSSSQEIAQLLSWFDGIKPPHLANDLWFACQTLLGEGFDNAVCHAHHNLPAETLIDLEVSILNEAVVIRIWDQGAPFDFEGRIQSLPSKVDTSAERGRGLTILEQLADHLSYVRTPEGRNCLTLIKAIAPNTAQADAHPSQGGQFQGFLQSMRQLLWLSCPQTPSATG